MDLWHFVWFTGTPLQDPRKPILKAGDSPKMSPKSSISAENGWKQDWKLSPETWVLLNSVYFHPIFTISCISKAFLRIKKGWIIVILIRIDILMQILVFLWLKSFFHKNEKCFWFRQIFIQFLQFAAHSKHCFWLERIIRLQRFWFRWKSGCQFLRFCF